MTNAQSKFQDADAKYIIKEAILRIQDFCEKNYKFSIVSLLSNKSNDDRVILLDNEDYVLLHKRGKLSHSVRGSDGVIRTYIYDENDGIYKTKRSTHILAPHIYMIYELRMNYGVCFNMEQYWNTYSGENDVFEIQSAKIREKLHTGNHHRNKKIIVPKSVYGMR
jgi:hypothetical protein